MEKEKSKFSELYGIDVSDYIETKKNGNVELTYLSWANCWKLFKEQCPDARYEIKHWEGQPFYYDENLGYMVETSITANGETHTMWLPVMDGANKAMKSKLYTYKVKKYNYGKWDGEYDEKEVQQATMFDINTAIMRCLVKNMAMFGLGLYIYAGEDVPEGETVKKGDKARYEKPTVEKVIEGMSQMTLDNCKKFYAKAIDLYGKETPEYKQWVKVWADKKDELEKSANNSILEAEAEFINNI